MTPAQNRVHGPFLLMHTSLLRRQLKSMLARKPTNLSRSSGTSPRHAASGCSRRCCSTTLRNARWRLSTLQKAILAVDDGWKEKLCTSISMRAGQQFSPNSMPLLCAFSHVSTCICTAFKICTSSLGYHSCNRIEWHWRFRLMPLQNFPFVAFLLSNCPIEAA